MKNCRGRLFLSCLVVLCSVSLYALDTTIKGGKMELVNQGEKVIFTKGVTMRRGTDTITSKKMVTNKKRDKVTVL